MSNTNNNTNYIICKATKSQRDYVLERDIIENEQEREAAIIYVAVDESGKIIGRIIAVSREIPSQIAGQYLTVRNLFVHPDYRRKGIGTALVNVVKQLAEAAGAVYLNGSVKATLEASMFWLRQGVTLSAFGKKQDDPSRPDSFGNYFHIFSYRLKRKALSGDGRAASIREVSKGEIPKFIDRYAPAESRRSYFMDKADELFGFAAVGNDGKPQGVILALPDSMREPLDSTHWGIFLFVEPQFRNRGIGRSLVLRIYRHAKESEKDVFQLTNIDSEDYIGFWQKIGFDVILWGVNEETGKRSATAMIRVR